jgi:ATP-dependent DNA ligase
MAAKSVIITDYLTQLPGKVDPDDPTVYLFNNIVSTGSDGKKTYWRIIVRLVVGYGTKHERFLQLLPEYFNSKTVLPDGAAAWLKVLSKKGENGKIRDTVPDIVTEGKNLGKANQTNAFTQGLRDALSKYNLQLKKAARAEENNEKNEEIETSVTLYPPMLAVNLRKLKKPFDYTKNVYVQRKYNGVRAPSVMDDDGSVIMYSRRRNIYPGFDEIKSELKQIFNEYYDFWGSDERFAGTLYLDGEIYKHGVSLQDIAGVARNEDKTMQLDYYIYDLFIPEKPDLTYSQRKVLFDELAKKFTHLPHVIFAETFRVNSEADVKRLYDRFTADEKYEGAMVRPDLPYRYSYNDYHSEHLLKLKGREDAEFKIVGYTQGTRGKSKGTLIMVCEANGHKFNVGMGEGITIEQAKEWYSRMGSVEPNDKTHFENHYLGRMLTVEYEELSKDGVPLRAKTTMVIRDYE